MHPTNEPRTPRRRRRSARSVVVVALAAVLALLLSACGSDRRQRRLLGDDRPVRSRRSRSAPRTSPRAKCCRSSTRRPSPPPGTTPASRSWAATGDLLYSAFESGDVNFALEYAASMLNYLVQARSPAGTDVDENVSGVTPLLEAKDIAIAEPSEAVDTNAFVMTKAEVRPARHHDAVRPRRPRAPASSWVDRRTARPTPSASPV